MRRYHVHDRISIDIYVELAPLDHGPVLHMICGDRLDAFRISVGSACLGIDCFRHPLSSIALLPYITTITAYVVQFLHRNKSTTLRIENQGNEHTIPVSAVLCCD